MVASKRLTLRLAKSGCMSLRCIIQSGPSLVMSPFPVNFASIR